MTTNTICLDDMSLFNVHNNTLKSLSQRGMNVVCYGSYDNIVVRPISLSVTAIAKDFMNPTIFREIGGMEKGELLLEQYVSEIDLSGLPNLETIGDRAFQFVGHDNVQFQAIRFDGLINLRTIGNYAFDGVGLKSSISEELNFGDCVALESIGTYSFAGYGSQSQTPKMINFMGCANLSHIGRFAFDRGHFDPTESIKSILNLK